MVSIGPQMPFPVWEPSRARMLDTGPVRFQASRARPEGLTAICTWLATNGAVAEIGSTLRQPPRPAAVGLCERQSQGRWRRWLPGVALTSIPTVDRKSVVGTVFAVTPRGPAAVGGPSVWTAFRAAAVSLKTTTAMPDPLMATRRVQRVDRPRVGGQVERTGRAVPVPDDQVGALLSREHRVALRVDREGVDLHRAAGRRRQGRARWPRLFPLAQFAKKKKKKDDRCEHGLDSAESAHGSGRYRRCTAVSTRRRGDLPAR